MSSQIIDMKLLAFLGIIFSFVVTCVALSLGKNMLPKDGGRAFAHDGKLSQGKPRGAGFVFILVFAVASILFLPIQNEYTIYIIMVIAAMLTGFLDDCAKSPWGELKKGLLDLAIAIMVSWAFVAFNSSTMHIQLTGTSIELPKVLFIILGTILIWGSINVTNCSDGVDGLSGTLSIVTLLSIYFVGARTGMAATMQYFILIMVACILGYLWFNATPSKMMMGDAGSRALGLFIAIAILKTGSPLLYIPLAFMLIIDGGLGLLKVSLIRVFKIHIMKNIRTPIHDHVRKNKDWSNTQTVFKFAIIQIAISFVVVWLI